MNRRGFFGLLAGAVAAAHVPLPEKELTFAEFVTQPFQYPPTAVIVPSSWLDEFREEMVDVMQSEATFTVTDEW